MPNRVAVITGASRGFGRALTLHLAANGWHVVACARSQPDPLPGAGTGWPGRRDPLPGAGTGWPGRRDPLPGAGTGWPGPRDPSPGAETPPPDRRDPPPGVEAASPDTPDPASPASNIEFVIQDVRAPVGPALLAAADGRPIDLLVNNAGVGAPARPLAETDPETILDAVDVNVAGPLRLTRALLPRLLAAPSPLIVNVTSRLGSLTAQAAGAYAGRTTSYAYRIAKAAQNMLTIALAQELAGRARCWAVHPGALTTAMGAADATTPPEVAAARLAELVESGDPASPRYLSLDGPELPW